ncbi:hypothetical protein P4B35_04490 [Pontiellaceae bacterium B12227]|nr:hypothetical protein [Pontiellaceae bacterium B12227]
MSREDTNKAFEEILSAYRTGDEERYADDFAESFQALETDRELENWFKDDQAFDDEFRAALNAFKVPEMKPVEAPKAEIKRFPFLKLAAAALFAGVLGGIGVSQYGAAQQRKTTALVDDMRQSMAAFAASSFELDTMNNDLNVLRDLIVSKGGTEAPDLETIFANGLPMGCKVVDWDGRKVSLYCFGNAAGQVVHAFVVPTEELNGPRAAAALQAVVEFSKRDTGGFVAGDYAYLLVSSMPGVDIKPFLLPAQETFAWIPESGPEGLLTAAVILPRL